MRRKLRQLFGTGSDPAATAGLAALELALAAPVLLLLLGGIVQLGIGLATGATLAHAAKAGAQFAAQKPENATSTAAIQRIVATALGSGAAGASITPTTFCECQYGQQTSCTATCSNGTQPLRYVRVVVSKPLEVNFGLFAYPNTLTKSVTLATSG